MMGSESTEEMESVALDDPLSKSHSTTATTTPSPSSALAAADSDPLLSPLSYRDGAAGNDGSYIDPPSYADVVFSPFDGESVGEVNGFDSPSGNSDGSGRGSFGFTGVVSRSSEYLKIVVSNPNREMEGSNSIVPGGNSYWTYLVTTRTNMPDFGGSEFSVRRRFRDVVILSDRLAEACRGFFIPPRPDKSVVESQVMQKQEFVEQRRVALEKYLMRLARHPVIRNSDELKVFLQVEGKLPLPNSIDVASRMLDGAVKLPKQLLGESAAVEPQEVVQPAKGGRDLLRLFKELRQSVAIDWGGSKPQAVEEDKEFLERKEKILDFEQQLNITSQQAEVMVKAQQDMGETLGELGLAFIKLTKFENEEAVFDSQKARAADMKNVATAAVKASRYYRELNNQTVKHLDILHEYLGLMLAVNGAFSDRSSALLTVQTLLSELATLNSRAEKLEVASSKIFGGDKSRLRKLEELKETIRATEDAKHVAVSEYERIKENNRSELERFDKERKADFLNMLKGFVINQAGYAEKIANVWTKVAEDTKGYAADST